MDLDSNRPFTGWTSRGCIVVNSERIRVLMLTGSRQTVT